MTQDHKNSIVLPEVELAIEEWLTKTYGPQTITSQELVTKDVILDTILEDQDPDIDWESAFSEDNSEQDIDMPF